MSWNYNPSDLANTPIDQVRLLIGDTESTDPQFQDEEIAFFLLTLSPYRAAAQCCRALSAKFSRSVNFAAGMTRIAYGDLAKAYALRAIAFDQQATRAGAGGMPYAGGISKSDKQLQDADSDRVEPQFTLGAEDNNTIPVGSVENETMDGTG